MLVTHQLQYLHEVDHIMVMNMGQIKTQGSYDYIKENDYAMLYVNDENFINSNARVDSPTDEEVWYEKYCVTCDTHNHLIENSITCSC